MPREIEGQSDLQEYAEQNGLVAWQGSSAFPSAATPAVARATRIVDARTSRGVSRSDAVPEGHRTGRVGGQCAATRGDGNQA
jgi:hypothetical protein